MGGIKLEADASEPSRKVLVENVVSVVPSDCPAESGRREADLLTSIQNGKSAEGGNTSLSFSRFNNTMAQYVIQTSGLNDLVVDSSLSS